jgi:hypoxanthine-DNA glycosylase
LDEPESAGSARASIVHGFPPIADGRARVLILGSMPSQASLAAGQYYAHPRNAFWPIIGALLGFSPDLPYPDRVARLRAGGIALWDVLHSCARHGSLDADIEEDSIRPNAIGPLLRQYPAIRRVFFNGTRSELAFRRYVLPEIGPDRPDLTYRRLPSTSPAHAARSLQQKLLAWRVVTDLTQPDSQVIGE